MGKTWKPIGTNQKYFPRVIRVLIRKHEPLHKSWAKISIEQKANIAPVDDKKLSLVSQDIDRTAQVIYKDWKNSFNEYFKLNEGGEWGTRTVLTYLLLVVLFLSI
ncbi:hypothetical protein TorRG33x02_175080 [Trema orientale]|uniref:Uncharacterized protein n=1 Tax=Trema orientale TaxID=63057 RepID=A0A2P5EMC0_TREOI|nr:hypothetical protein TorRG33x02_175080 [Trema orientale]